MTRIPNRMDEHERLKIPIKDFVIKIINNNKSLIDLDLSNIDIEAKSLDHIIKTIKDNNILITEYKDYRKHIKIPQIIENKKNMNLIIKDVEKLFKQNYDRSLLSDKLPLLKESTSTNISQNW